MSLGFHSKPPKGTSTRPFQSARGVDDPPPPRKQPNASPAFGFGGYGIGGGGTFPAFNTFKEDERPPNKVAAMMNNGLNPGGNANGGYAPNPMAAQNYMRQQQQQQQQQQPHPNNYNQQQQQQQQQNRPRRTAAQNVQQQQHQNVQQHHQNNNNNNNHQENNNNDGDLNNLTPKELLKKLKAKAEEAKDHNYKAKAISQAEDARKVQTRIEDLETRMNSTEDSIKEICESLSQVYTQLTELNLNGVSDASASRSATQSDLEELTKIVTSQVETISNLTQRIDHLNQKISGLPVGGGGGAGGHGGETLDVSIVKNASKALALAEETKKMMHETQDRFSLHETMTEGKMELLGDRVTSLQTSLMAEAKERADLQGEIAQTFKQISNATFWMYGTALDECAMYHRIPEVPMTPAASEEFVDNRMELIPAGAWLMLINPIEATETGEWVQARIVDEVGDFRQGWVPILSCPRYIQGNPDLPFVAADGLQRSPTGVLLAGGGTDPSSSNSQHWIEVLGGFTNLPPVSLISRTCALVANNAENSENANSNNNTNNQNDRNLYENEQQEPEDSDDDQD